MSSRPTDQSHHVPLTMDSESSRPTGHGSEVGRSHDWVIVLAWAIYTRPLTHASSSSALLLSAQVLEGP